MLGRTKEAFLFIGLLFNIDHRDLLGGDPLRVGRPFFGGANHSGSKIEES